MARQSKLLRRSLVIAATIACRLSRSSLPTVQPLSGRKDMGRRLCVLIGTASLVLALAVPATFSRPAGAVTQTVRCRDLTVGYISGAGTVGHCHPVKATGGSGTVSSFNMNGGQIAWANGTTTSWTTTGSGPPILGDEREGASRSCPVGTDEFELTGFVTASTNSLTTVGEKVSLEVCVRPRAFESNEPRSVLLFGG
jgi:hypothetical protein